MYCGIADIRAFDASITEAAYSDQAVSDAIELAGRIIDKETSQWFEPRTKTLTLAGNNIDDLVLPVPAIEITSVLVDEEEFSSDYYKVMQTGNGIKRFLRHRFGVWPQDGEIVVNGRFGCVEEDESTPPEAKRLCMILGVVLLKKEGDQPVFKSESFKDHSYTLRDDEELFWGSSEADRLLRLLTAPVIPGVV